MDKDKPNVNWVDNELIQEKIPKNRDKKIERIKLIIKYLDNEKPSNCKIISLYLKQLLNKNNNETDPKPAIDIIKEIQKLYKIKNPNERATTENKGSRFSLGNTVKIFLIFLLLKTFYLILKKRKTGFKI